MKGETTTVIYICIMLYIWKNNKTISSKSVCASKCNDVNGTSIPVALSICQNCDIRSVCPLLWFVIAFL